MLPPADLPDLDMSVCAVVVTYADRASLLSQVVAALLREGVSRIVVVDNGSRQVSAEKLAALAAAEPRIELARDDTNRGSAPGFAKGLSLALAGRGDFVWVMDDDNEPAPGALACLLAFWATLERPDKRTGVALSSFRRDRPNFVRALGQGDPGLVLPPRNAFAGFHIGEIAAKFLERVRAARPTTAELPAFGKISACAYGGLFCHRDLIGRLGLPDTSYVLYTDDFDYTHALTRQGGDIWLLRDSEVVDLESSYCLPRRKALLYHSVFDAPRDAVVYYGFRNTIHFARQHLTTRWPLYRLNMVLFLMAMLGLALLRGRAHRLHVLWQAIRDGEAGRLGLRAEFPL